MSGYELSTIVYPEGVKATQQELAEVNMAIVPEREWMDGLTIFANDVDLLRAAQTGELVEVVDTPDFRILPSIANDGPHRRSFPFLLPGARAALLGLSWDWRQAASNLGLPEDIVLAVTSLGRSSAYQAELRSKGKLAVENSSHERGAAVDIAVADYYRVDRNSGRITSVSLREPETAKVFEASYLAQGAPPVQTERLGPEHYDERVAIALKQVANVWHDKGLVNAVPEFDKTKPDNEVIHFGINVKRFSVS